MSKNVAVFVDVANLYYSARGQDVDVDYVALLKAATKGRDLIRAYAYSGLDPENENQRKFIDFLGKNGYKVLTKDIRKFGDGRVKANLDIELVVDLFRLADRMDIAVIVSGDGDFAPAIRALQDKGVRCEVISFRPNTSSDLLAVTDEFIDVMKIAGIGRNSKEAKAQRGMSAPEMPAKEVSPEFGFREASPTVAKAALAALREGGREAGGSDGARGRRRGRSAAAETPAPSRATTEASGTQETDEGASAGADGELRKRRRRRGGRGRGRGRSRAEQAAAAEGAAEGDGGIGWVELDDVSQLAELEEMGDLDAEREYSFEEADAATLAELGLGAKGAAGEGEEAAGAEPKKPARRRARTKQDAAAAGATTATAEAPDAEMADGEAAEKPRRATRRKSSTTTGARTRGQAKAGDDASDDGDAKGSKGAAAPATGTRKRSTTRSRTASRKPAGDDAAGDKPAEKPTKTTTRRTRSTKRSAPEGAPDSMAEAAPDREGEAAGEGIWQRFRMGRTGRQTT